MSQFRQDPVSGEWVIIAPERSKRPHMAAKKTAGAGSLKQCPFENLQKSGNWPPILEYEENGQWRMVVIPNKYPALIHELLCPVELVSGPYRVMEAVGYHELLVTRDHKSDFSELSAKDAERVFLMFADRYRSIDRDNCMAYLSVFGNRGASAGASVKHPHYQLMALPIVPPSVQKSYDSAERYFKKHKRCAHCELMAYERKQKLRVVAENDSAIAIAPFVSYEPYEIRIYPKKHLPSFESTPAKVLGGTAHLLQDVIRRLRRKLDDPDYNFYIHTAPLRNQEKFGHYHWHIEISPRVSIDAGFEFATGIDVNPVDPAAAARLLR